MNRTGGTKDFNREVVSILLQNSYNYFKVVLVCFPLPAKHLFCERFKSNEYPTALFYKPTGDKGTHKRQNRRVSFYKNKLFLRLQTYKPGISNTGCQNSGFVFSFPPHSLHTLNRINNIVDPPFLPYTEH